MIHALIAGYMEVSFFSDASISGPGFALTYNTSTSPQMQASCPNGQRVVTLFVQTGYTDVFDIGWAVLEGAAADPSSLTATVVAAGGEMPPLNANFTAAAPAVLAAATKLAAASQAAYRPWSLASELRCLAPGNYTLVLLATDAASWDSGSVAVHVPERALLAPLGAGSSGLALASFAVPAAADASVAGQAAQWQPSGQAGLQAQLTVPASDLVPDDVKGSVMGSLRIALAAAAQTQTQLVVITDQKSSSGGGSSGSGRRLVGQAGKAAGRTPTAIAHALRRRDAATVALARGDSSSKSPALARRVKAARQEQGRGGGAGRPAKPGLKAALLAPKPRRRLLQDDGSTIISFKIIGGGLLITCLKRCNAGGLHPGAAARHTPMPDTPPLMLLPAQA
jgi:hypothetical protein